MQSNRIIQVEEKVPPHLLVPLSIQHMFAMFGASVLVPFIFKMNPAIVLFMNGIGTLLFILITKGKAPAYLGSSFAFIAPATIVINNWGYQYALGGFVVVGACGCVLAFIIYKCGTDWINVVLPPAAMGPVVALIGLELAGSAASTGCIVGDSVTTGTVITFLVTLAVAVFGSVLFRGFFSTIPILIAIICGYIAGVFTGVIKMETIVDALHTSFISIPNFQTPKFDINAILIILPVLLVIANEHIGHQLVTGKVIGRDLLKDPGLHRSLFADNFSTMISGFIGSVPTTTYGENIGVMAITKVYSVRVIGGAAVLSIICSFVGPLAALIQTIPGPVIGGICGAANNLIYGFTGLFSLGHAGFLAIGAYVGALCTLLPEQKEIMWILDPIIWPFSVLHTPFWVAVIAGGLVAMIFAFIIAVPVLRLGDDYLGIATLGFAEIIRVVIVNATSITNGSLGIKGIPGEATLLTCYIWTVITLVVLSRLIFSNFGNVLRCIRDNEIAAGVMGINVFRYKVLSFCVGAFFAGVGGALLGSHLSTIDPKMFNFLLTFNVLMFVVAGGLGSLTGSLLGATIVTILLEWLRAIEEPMDFGVFEIPGIPGMRMVVFSLILLAIILFRREGIMGTREITWKTIFSLGRRKA